MRLCWFLDIELLGAPFKLSLQAESVREKAMSAERETVIGEWWFPRDPSRRVQGSLTFPDDTVAALHLAGELPFEFGRFGELEKPEVIFGRDPQNRAIVVLDASLETTQMTYSDGREQRRQSLLAYSVLVGAEHPRPDLTFDRITFSFEGLSLWVNNHYDLFDRDVSNEEGTQSVLVVRDAIRIPMTVPGGQLLLFSGVGESWGNTRRLFEVTTSWSFTPDTPVNFDELWYGIVRPLKYLFVLLTGEPTAVCNVSLRLPAPPDVPEHERVYLQAHLTTARHHLPDKRRWWEWPVPLKDIATDLAARVSDWLKAEKRLRTALPLAFAVLEREKESYLESEYLMLAQAAEALHRRHERFSQEDFDEAELTTRLRILMQGVDKDWHSWLKTRLRYSNEPTFRNRLRDLVSYVGDWGREAFPRQVVDAIVRARNDLTHGLVADEGDEHYGEIALLRHKLVLLIAGVLLRDMGLSEQQVRAAILRSPTNRARTQWRPPV